MKGERAQRLGTGWRSMMTKVSATLACSAGLVVLVSGPSGAQVSTKVTFGAPTSGLSCSEDLRTGFGNGYVNEPFDSWNGIPLLLEEEFPGKYPVPGPNCGDVKHGSKAFSFMGLKSTGSFSHVGTKYGIATTGVVARGAGPWATLEAATTAQQTVVGSGTPVIAPGDGAFTLSMTYTNTSTFDGLVGVRGQSAISLSEAPATQPTCSGGGQVVVTISGNSAGEVGVGTWSFSETWTCPAGQTISAVPVTVTLEQFSEVEHVSAGSTINNYATTIDSATLTAS
jgi:hypothetical protein